MFSFEVAEITECLASILISLIQPFALEINDTNPLPAGVTGCIPGRYLSQISGWENSWEKRTSAGQALIITTGSR